MVSNRTVMNTDAYMISWDELEINCPAFLAKAFNFSPNNAIPDASGFRVSDEGIYCKSLARPACTSASCAANADTN